MQFALLSYGLTLSDVRLGILRGQVRGQVYEALAARGRALCRAERHPFSDGRCYGAAQLKCLMLSNLPYRVLASPLSFLSYNTCT